MKIQNFLEWSLSENDSSLESVDKAPERVRDTRGRKAYATKPPKAVYLKKGSLLGEKTLKFLKATLKEKDLFLISDNQWLSIYMDEKGEEVLRKGEASERLYNEEAKKVGDSRDFEYVKVDKLAFKEFNVYKARVYGFEKTTSYGVSYSVGTYTFWFINKNNALFSGNLKALSRAFGLDNEEEDEGHKPSWAIISASNPYNHRDTYHGWISNDGSDGEEILSSQDFRKVAKRAADNKAARHFHEHMGGTFKVYTNKEKFVSDFEKLTGTRPDVK